MRSGGVCNYNLLSPSGTLTDVIIVVAELWSTKWECAAMAWQVMHHNLTQLHRASITAAWLCCHIAYSKGCVRVSTN